MNAWRKWLAGVGLATGMVCAGDALAEQERLTVLLHSDSSVMPYDAGMAFYVDVPNRSATECRHDLERILDGASQLIRQSGWTAKCAVWDEVNWRDGPGVYRIRVFSRDVGNPIDVMMKERILVLLGKGHPDYWPSHTALQTQVWENYRHAFTTIRDTLASIKSRSQGDRSFGREFEWFSDEAVLITELLNPEGRPAPSGGNAYIAGEGDATTGAVGIRIWQPPAASDDWSYIMVEVDLPNYIDLDVNGDIEKLLLWDDIPLN